MKTQYMKNLKTNERGEVDINYYVAQGRRARANAIAEFLLGFIARFKARRSSRPQLPLNVNFRH